MHYVMEAAAEQGIEMLVLDRPNPNGAFVDGPVLEKQFRLCRYARNTFTPWHDCRRTGPND